MGLLHKILSEVYKLVELDVPKLIERIEDARRRAVEVSRYAIRIARRESCGKLVAIDAGYSRMKYRAISVVVVSLAKVVKDGGFNVSLSIRPLLVSSPKGLDAFLAYYVRKMELESAIEEGEEGLVLLDGTLSLPEVQQAGRDYDELAREYAELRKRVVEGDTPVVAVAKDLSVNAYTASLQICPLKDWLKNVVECIHEQLAISWILGKGEYLPPVRVAEGIYATYVNLGGGLPLYVELNRESYRRLEEVLAIIASVSPTGYPTPLALADKITRVTKSMVQTVQGLIERSIAKFVPREYAWLFARQIREQYLY